jgi:hypothetical protein
MVSGVSHMVWNGHNYFLSWREPWHKFEDWDWFNGRNFCRDRCMDLVSFDTPGEYQLFAGIMRQGKYWGPRFKRIDTPGNTKGGSITVPLTTCLTGLEFAI